MTQMDGAARLAALRAGCTTEQAFALFDALPAVPTTELSGRWKGSELATGHPMDGVLSASGWYGKQFDGPDDVHPLLFTAGGEVFAVDPKRVPVGLAGRVPRSVVDRGRKMLPYLEPAIRTTKPRARLRELEFRGKSGAAMVYDHLPIIDVFRQVDADTLLGVMDQRGDDGWFFFLLHRD